MLTVAELTMSRSGTVEICMAHDLGTAIAEIIFGRLLCSSFGTLGLRSMGFGSGFRSQKDRRRPKRYENSEMQVHSSEIPKSSRSWLVCHPCRVCCKMCFIFGNFLLRSLFLILSRFLLGKKPNHKQNIFKWYSLQNEFLYKKTSVE